MGLLRKLKKHLIQKFHWLRKEEKFIYQDGRKMNLDELKKEYDILEPEFQIIQAMIEVRSAQKLTQADLVTKAGIDRMNISRLENGNANPSLKTLKRIVEGWG